ncbi:hypothetical protein [Streptomyces sp. NBC_00670]|uniref:hypothetical protein n=1 Tax=Streptomyces sp. NBC_00670 TaxID=2975804 RepID=UPI002E35F9C5|nr:hypothetical protein [Streptomyces sp. NBC_00670]
MSAWTRLMRRLARRCPIHDRASPHTVARLEAELGIDTPAPGEQPGGGHDFVATYTNPRIIDCGLAWCQRRRTRT